MPKEAPGAMNTGQVSQFHHGCEDRPMIRQFRISQSENARDIDVVPKRHKQASGEQINNNRYLLTAKESIYVYITHSPRQRSLPRVRQSRASRLVGKTSQSSPCQTCPPMKAALHTPASASSSCTLRPPHP